LEDPCFAVVDQIAVRVVMSGRPSACRMCMARAADATASSRDSTIVAIPDGEPLGGPDEIERRDAHRWELDPSSAESPPPGGHAP
jgi:hypothetical protein